MQEKPIQISIEELEQNFTASQTAFASWKSGLDERERLLYGQPKTSNASGKVNVNDPRLFTQAFERSIRVMSQLPTGKFKGVSSNDTGKNMLMNLLVDKYVIPNANSQFDFLAKLRMVDWYSLAYGTMVALVDWVVRDGYIGPDLFLIPIRYIYPQPGVSFADMSWCQVVSEVDKKFIKEKIKDPSWRNIEEFLRKTEDSIGNSLADKDPTQQSFDDRLHDSTSAGSKKTARFRLITEYRRDRWITYSPEYKLILRDIPNPHQNNKLPFAVKFCIPLLNFCFGLSEIEIGKSMASVINSLYNLAIEDAKMQLYPPTIIDPSSVILSSIKMAPAKRWLLNGSHSREPSAFRTMTRGAQSALEMRQMAIGSLQTLSGTSDTTVKQGTEYSMGKTPQALRMQEARQSARDEVDRFYMELFLKDVYARVANLIVKKMPQSVTLRLFKEEIDAIAKFYPDILELINPAEVNKTRTNDTISVAIPKTFLENYQFDYEIVTGSTYKIDQQAQAQNLQAILEIAQKESVQGALNQVGKKLDIAEIVNRLLINSGIQDPDKILLDDGTSQESMPSPAPNNFPPNIPAAIPGQIPPPMNLPPNPMPANLPQHNAPQYPDVAQLQQLINSR